MRNREHVLGYLLTHPCVDCGEDDPVRLEFDHVREEKLTEVSRLANDPANLNKVIQEIAKCDVRCVNCHRRKTSGER
jgi:hypothetical protein